MHKRLTQAAVVFIVVLAAAQFVRPVRANPAIDVSRTIQAQASELGAVLDRSCRDCHSNATVWPGYTQVAPLSWLMSYAVTKGREVVNFSEWNRSYELALYSGQSIRTGNMPPIKYSMAHREANLTEQEARELARGLDAMLRAPGQR